MRSSILFKCIPILFLCMLFACQPVHAPLVESSTEFSSYDLEPLYSYLETSAEEEESAQEELFDDGLWNVEDVDISDVDKTRKLLSFTFDDAPSKTLENILAVFAAFNEENPDCRASATVFFNGYLFDRHSAPILYAVCALGFELGNHTYSHHDLTALNAERITEEIEKTDKLLAKFDQRERHLLRAPFGKINETVKACAQTPLIDWTIDTLDWTGASEESIYNTVLDNCFSGAIVLMHDGYGHTVSALKRLLPDLKARGYQVVSVSKMMKAHGCKFRRGEVYIRARKQN